MKTRRWRQVAAVGAGLAGLGLLALFWRTASVDPARPNILLITIDTLRADRVGVYGGTVATPTLDRIAREGTRFEVAYAPVPLTLPSHTSMLSGLLPPAHTVRTNDGFQIPSGVRLVSESLHDAGYDTGAFVGAAVLHADTGIARGFSSFDQEVGPGGARPGDEVAKRAAAWLAARGERPFFLWVHFFDPHLPYRPPEPYRSQYAERPYDGEVAYTDATLARLIALLEEQRWLDRTAIIVAGDHGEALGDHGERSHGVALYDATMRVPLLVRLPQAEAAGQVVSVPVSIAEIGPTILDLAGLPRGGLAESLLTRVRHPAGGPSDPVISETLYLHRLLGWSPLYAVTVGTRKLIEAPQLELYDLESDPRESNNLADAMPGEAEKLRAVLHGELAAIARSAAQPAAAAADPEAAQRVRALGYATGDARRLDPIVPVGGVGIKDRMALWIRVETALEHSQQGAHQEAAEEFEAVLRDDPGNVLALRFLGAEALARGDLAVAVRLNRRVLESGLHIADAASNLALALHRQGRSDEALDVADQALAASANHLAARLNRATILADLGRRREALEEIERVQKVSPDHEGARALRARLDSAAANAGDPDLDTAERQIGSGNLDAARRTLLQAAARRPDDANLHDLLGTVYARQGDLAAARRAFEAAVARDPQSAERIERLAAVLHQTGDRQGARVRFEQALAVDPSRPAPKLSLAILDLEAGNPSAAIRRLEGLTTGWEGAAQAWFYLGEARAATGDPQGARRAYAEAVRIARPDDPIRREAARRLAR